MGKTEYMLPFSLNSASKPNIMNMQTNTNNEVNGIQKNTNETYCCSKC